MKSMAHSGKSASVSFIMKRDRDDNFSSDQEPNGSSFGYIMFSK